MRRHHVQKAASSRFQQHPVRSAKMPTVALDIAQLSSPQQTPRETSEAPARRTSVHPAPVCKPSRQSLAVLNPLAWYKLTHPGASEALAATLANLSLKAATAASCPAVPSLPGQHNLGFHIVLRNFSSRRALVAGSVAPFLVGRMIGSTSFSGAANARGASIACSPRG